MVYPSDQHTATDARWVNHWGWAYNPQRTKLVWSSDSSALGRYEVWDLTTRTYVDSGALDQGTHAVSGSVQGVAFALTRDNYLYNTASGYLSRWASFGAGAQVIKGTVTGQAGVVCLEAGDGSTYIGTCAFSFLADGYLYNHTADVGPDFLDTSAQTGTDFSIRYYVVDGAGDIWAIGQGRDLANNVCAFWRVKNVSGEVRPAEFFTVTMPNNAPAGTPVTACYVKSGVIDKFVVNWNGTVALVNYAGTLGATLAIGGDFDTSFYCVGTGHNLADATLWLSDTEYNLSDLSVRRQMPVSLWGYVTGQIQQGIVYDPTNKALLVGLENTNQDFAWLFLPQAAGSASGRGHIYSRVGGVRR